jgi:hypothetical protein
LAANLKSTNPRVSRRGRPRQNASGASTEGREDLTSTFVDYLAPDAPGVADALTVPASVGEFWMIGYLLVRGVNRRVVGDTQTDAVAASY